MENRSKGGVSGIIFGALVGFSFFTVASGNNSRINKKLPEKKIKNVSFFPRVKVYKGENYYHIHHWIIFAAIYIPFLLKRNAKKSKFLNGFLLGSILQGLSFKDRFRIKNTYQKN